MRNWKSDSLSLSLSLSLSERRDGQRDSSTSATRRSTNAWNPRGRRRTPPKRSVYPRLRENQETETSYKEILQTRNRKPRAGNALRRSPGQSNRDNVHTNKVPPPPFAPRRINLNLLQGTLPPRDLSPTKGLFHEMQIVAVVSLIPGKFRADRPAPDLSSRLDPGQSVQKISVMLFLCEPARATSW